MAFSCTLNTCIYPLLIVNLALSVHSLNSSSFFKTRKTETDALLSTGWWDNGTSCYLKGIECNKAGRVISIHLTNIDCTRSGLGKFNFSCFPYLQKLDLLLQVLDVSDNELRSILSELRIRVIWLV